MDWSQVNDLPFTSQAPTSLANHQLYDTGILFSYNRTAGQESEVDAGWLYSGVSDYEFLSIYEKGNPNPPGGNYTFDFSGLSGGVNDLRFDIGGVSTRFSAGVTSSDVLSIILTLCNGSTISGTAIDSYLFYSDGTPGTLAEPSASTFSINNGVITGNSLGTPDDHGDPNSLLQLDFSGLCVSQIDIDFSPTRDLAGAYTSAGIGIYDFSFTAIPEPSSALLLSVAVIGYAGRRKRAA